MSNTMEETGVTHGLHGIIERTPSCIIDKRLCKQGGLPECDRNVNDVRI